MSEEIVPPNNESEPLFENPMLIYIAKNMKMNMSAPDEVTLEVPICVDLKIGEDFHYGDLVNGLGYNGHLYLARALLEQSDMLRPIADHLPILDSEVERGTAQTALNDEVPVEEVVEVE